MTRPTHPNATDDATAKRHDPRLQDVFDRVAAEVAAREGERERADHPLRLGHTNKGDVGQGKTGAGNVGRGQGVKAEPRDDDDDDEFDNLPF